MKEEIIKRFNTLQERIQNTEFPQDESGVKQLIHKVNYNRDMEEISFLLSIIEKEFDFEVMVKEEEG